MEHFTTPIKKGIMPVKIGENEQQNKLSNTNNVRQEFLF